MYSRWTSHLKTDEEKDSFKKEIYSCKRVLERLKEIIDEDLDSLNKSEMDHKSYLVPAWDCLQAHRNGNRQVYQQIKTLVDLDQQKGSIHDYKLNGSL